MSKLTPLSVSDSFNASSNTPRNPDGPDWKTMLFQLFLVVAGTSTFGWIISRSNKKMMNGITASNEAMFKRLQEANKEKSATTDGDGNPKSNPTPTVGEKQGAADINKT